MGPRARLRASPDEGDVDEWGDRDGGDLEEDDGHNGDDTDESDDHAGVVVNNTLVF